MNIGPIETIAAEIARKAHAGQTRRDGITPYITHPAAVADIVRHATGDDSLVAAAWLHDVLEDTDHTAESLRLANIPEHVISIVQVLTRTMPYDKYLHRVKAAPWARPVKIADMLHNLTDSPTEEQKAKYTAGIMFLSQ